MVAQYTPRCKYISRKERKYEKKKKKKKRSLQLFQRTTIKKSIRKEGEGEWGVKEEIQEERSKRRKKKRNEEKKEEEK